MASSTKEIQLDLSPAIIIYKNSQIQRLWGSPPAPPSHPDPKTLVSSKDITISPQVSARLYLPTLQTPNQKLPILVYYHWGGFVAGSPFQEQEHCYLNILVSKANVVVVSVDYRLAPEHPLPAAYQDSWTALQWVASHADENMTKKDQWLVDHGDFGKLFIAGDSAGGNITHNMAMRAGREKLNADVTILGAIIAFPYFWGSKTILDMSNESNMKTLEYRLWEFVHPSADNGIDNPMINPVVDGGLSLKELPFLKMFVCTGERDVMRARAIQYVEALRKSGWVGEVEFVDVERKNHCFQIVNPNSEKAIDLIKSFACFINQ
ncbi:deacetylase [Lithospermum erythrorhizon]|uniref:Deacetylase n=1 Tax=Lithospermum erythrorhizon TaxID=34254 RepID=A0AAV3QFW1_LITER